MLRRVAGGPQVIVCTTCRVPGNAVGAPRDAAGRHGGALLADALRRAQRADPALAGIGIEDMPCLFACARSCAVHIRGPGRIGYILGDFAPDADAAQAILAYACRHAESADGEVPYRQWPEGVKDHFIARVPPEGYAVS